jgi:Uma2 family endonuclease
VRETQFRPTHHYTAREYVALGETDQRYELQEGSFLVLPGPSPRHLKAALALAIQLRVQLPRGVKFVPDAEVDLGLAVPTSPGTVRRPDLVAVGDGAGARVLRAPEIQLVVEVAAPGSYRMDYQIKRSEYADAGIPHYWIIDVADPISLLACELSGSDYVDNGKSVGVFSTTNPFPVTVNLANLVS